MPASGGGGGPIQFAASATFTDAQIKALPTTGLQVVPAPGANRYIQIVQSVWNLDASHGAYTNVDPLNVMQLVLGSPSVTNMSMPFTNSFQGFFGFADYASVLAPGDTKINTGNTEAVWQGSPTQMANLGLFMSMTNGAAGNLTGGNAANSLRVFVWYAVLPT